MSADGLNIKIEEQFGIAQPHAKTVFVPYSPVYESVRVTPDKTAVTIRYVVKNEKWTLSRRRK